MLGVWISGRPVAEIIIFYKPNQYVQSQCALTIKMQHEVSWTTDYGMYLLRREKKKAVLKKRPLLQRGQKCGFVNQKTMAVQYDYGTKL